MSDDFGGSSAENVDSPCIGICSTLFDDICKGCGRTILEVSNWVAMTPEEKNQVWMRITEEGTAMRFTNSSKS
jgi:predicted Fe-S protein YdhL (DUF1289 family)